MGVTLPKSSETARAARGMRREATAGPSAGGQAPPADAGATVHSPPPDIGNAPGLIAAPEPNTERQGVTVGGPRTPEREGPDGLGETKKVVSLKELYRRSSNVTADALLDARSDDSEAEDGPGPVAKKQKVSVDGPPTPARDGPEMKAEGFETNCQARHLCLYQALASVRPILRSFSNKLVPMEMRETWRNFSSPSSVALIAL